MKIKRKIWFQINHITLLAIVFLFVVPNFALANTNQGVTSEASIQFVIIDNDSSGGEDSNEENTADADTTTDDEPNQNRLPQAGAEVARWSAWGGILIVIGIIVAKMKGKDHSI